jgi:uncharacterized protein (TIGR02147 family)
MANKMNKRNNDTKTETLPDVCVYNYTDYRLFLTDYYTEQKRKNPAFSYRYFASRASVSSSGLYKEIIDGKRGLSRSLIGRFANALKLSKRESEYFEFLVYFTDAQSVEEKKLYFGKMMAAYESKAYRLHANQFEYFSKWYYVAVKEALSFDNGSDVTRLAASLNPSIRPDQAAKALLVLEKLGLIRKTEEGFKRVDQIISTGLQGDDPNVNLLGMITFQKEMLRLGIEAYDRHPKKKLDMSTLTLAISEETYGTIKEEIAAFRKKLLSIAARDEKADRLYQINYQVFPLTKDGRP